MPNSRAVASPSCRIFSQSSERTFSTISSMRAGWMRPSTMSFSRACRATSRRSGSKAEMTMASGVSSMMRSTPVAASSARMLRPSRPMMRPLRSSEGSSTTETVASTTVSEARRWIAMPMMRRAFWVACSLASSSMRRIRPAVSIRTSLSTDLTRSRLASTAVRPAICSSRLRCSSITRRASAWASSTFFWASTTAFSLRLNSSSRRSCWESLRSRFSSFCWTRFSRVAISCRRAWTVLSNSTRAARTFSLASMSASRSFDSACLRASARAFSASVRIPRRSDPTFFLRKKKPTASRTTATTRPAAAAIAKVVFIRPPKKPGGRSQGAGAATRRTGSVSSDEG